MFFSFAIAGQSKIDSIVASEMKAAEIPGVAIAVVKDGKIIVEKGYGLANVELNVSVTPKTVFQSGSVGKQFTAGVVILLVEDGKLKLDDALTKFFADAPVKWRGITIRHLLTHTSGLGDYPENLDMRRDYTEDELYRMVRATPLQFAPGDSWEYSNLGYLMLGIVIRKVTGRFYGDVLRDRIFKPLGMSTARVISESDIVPNRAAGYRVVKGELKNQEWVSPSLNTTADGSLYVTLGDMLKWDAALTNGTLFRRESLAMMFTPVRLSSGKTHPYGFGWETETINGRRIVKHDGEWQGFTSAIYRDLDAKLSVVVFANLDDADCMSIATAIAASFAGQ